MDSQKIKETLNLPRTGFPMKANLSANEPKILEFWEKEGIYHAIRENKSGLPKFILHDGPPYATGHIHIGTALNKVLKDFIVKYKNITGFDAPYVPGWDCHGLPIENKVEKTMKDKKESLSKLEIRKRCYDYAVSYVDIMREEFKRLGVLGRWEEPYLTLNPVYEAVILRVLASAVRQGYVYRQLKPIHWCMGCTTALAEAELEYSDAESDSIFVRFALKRAGIASPLKEYEGRENVFFMIWTTTPWTIPANMALAVHPDLDYGIYSVDGELLILASELKDSLESKLGIGSFKLLKQFRGNMLEGDIARHPLIDRESAVVLANYVTLEQGSGIVHTAPGHGQEDYQTGQKYNIETFCPVDEKGRFTSGFAPFEGVNVFESNPGIVQMLKDRGMLLKSESFSHSYPHCWRCKKPVIFRATEQWFINIDHNGLRKKALDSIRSVDWIPGWGMNRIYAMIENRPDWCISRQRNWGVPIVAVKCSDCGEISIDADLIDRVADIVEKEGIGIYFEKNIREIIPGLKCPRCESHNIIQEEDILDVWFESGVSHKAVLTTNEELSWPSDLYLEGSDQHRGWFNSSLILSLISEKTPPYRQVLTHGFVVDEQGKKMSKSLGNFISHEDIIGKYGGDILRMWVASEDYREDIRVSRNIIDNLSESYRKIRNTFRFALSNLYDFNPDKDMVRLENMTGLDKFYFEKYLAIAERIKSAYEKYNFHIVVQNLVNFASIDLSSQYHDIIKDRLYVNRADSRERRSTQSCIYRIIKGLLTLSSPILSFTADEAWQYLPKSSKDPVSVHLSTLGEYGFHFEKTGIFEDILSIRSAVSKKLEILRKENVIGLSLDSHVSIKIPARLFEQLNCMKDELKEILMISEIELVKSEEKEKDTVEESIEISAKKHDGEKCPRCWRYFYKSQELCPRCSSIIKDI